MRNATLVLWVAGFLVALSSFGTETDASFTLAVKLDGAYNKGFTVCTLIRPSESFNVEWTQGSLKGGISGVLRQAEGDVYPLTLTVNQGFTDQVRTSMTWEPKLKLGTADYIGGIVSTVHVENEEVLLTKGSCPNKTDWQTK
jgi:hypothetical protein